MTDPALLTVAVVGTGFFGSGVLRRLERLHGFTARVAANRTLLQRVEAKAQLPVLCPPPRLCTDNAAMIAAAGYFRFSAGERSDMRLDVEPGMPIA